MTTSQIIDQINTYNYFDVRYVGNPKERTDISHRLYPFIEHNLLRMPREGLYVKATSGMLNHDMAKPGSNDLIIKVLKGGPFYNRVIQPMINLGEPIPNHFNIVESL